MEEKNFDMDGLLEEDDHSIFEEKQEEKKDNQMTGVRVGYCLANIARMDFNLFGFYLNPYLLDAVGMDPSLVGMLLLSRQLWDAFSDPIVGHLSDNTKTKWGRRRPWIVCSFPFLGVSWILFWTMLSDLGETWLFLYYLFILLAYTTSNTLTQLPFLCLMQEISPTYGIRTKIVALQEFFCQTVATIATYAMGELSTSFTTDSGAINYKLGYIVAGLAISPFIALPRMISSLTIKEERTDRVDVTQPILEKREDKEDEGVREVENGGLRELATVFFAALRFSDFSLLVACWAIVNTMLYLFTSNIVLYVKYYIISDSLDFVIVTLLQLGFTIGFPLWVKIVPYLGKIRTSQVGCVGVCFLSGGLFFIQQDQGILLAILITFLGILASGLYLAIFSMQPDCCAACMEKLNTRNEGMLYSVLLFGGKAGGGIALGVSSVALGMAGYEPSLGETITQNEATLLTMRALLFIVPCVSIAILFIMTFFIKDYQNEYSTTRFRTVHG